jgi:polyferredoxin
MTNAAAVQAPYFMYPLLADSVLLLHLAVVLFVVGGLAAIVVGSLAGWHWVHSVSFRAAHLAAIGVVVVQAWLGQTCPLTTLESWLRLQAGEARYNKGFIEHWVQSILFYDAPSWVFTVLYTLFALIVLVSWWRFPPRRRNPTSPP